MTKFRTVRIAVIASAIIGGVAGVTPANAQVDPYAYCLRQHCFGNFPNDPAGYEACRAWCWDHFPSG